MAIDPERVKTLFQTAIERNDPASRRAFLDDEIGADAELRDRLDALLAAYDQPPGALDRHSPPIPKPPMPPSPSRRPRREESPTTDPPSVNRRATA